MFARIVALLLAIAGTALGLLLVGVGFIGALGGDRSPEVFLSSATALPGGVLLLGLGLAAGWLAWLVGRGRGARPIWLPPVWLAALVFAVAVAAGSGALALGLWWLFLPFGTLAVFVPIAAVGRLGLPRADGLPGWGRILPAFAWGAIVTPILAIAAELIAAVGAIVAAVLGFTLQGQAYTDIVAATWQRLQGRTLTDPQTEALFRIIAAQPIVLLIGGFILVFVAPAAEELCKFGAALLFGRTRADRPDRDTTLTVFLIGLASGLGFAATENIFYAAQGGASGWTPVILTRAVTPLMHGLASALFALGWAQQRRAPHGWALLRGALLALGLHAAWNFCGGLLIVAALFAGAGGTQAGLAVLLIMLAFGTLVGLAIASVATLLRLRRTLAAEAAGESRGPVATTGEGPGPAGIAPGHAGAAVPDYAPVSAARADEPAALEQPLRW